MAYVPESIPETDIQTLLETYWDTQGGSIPMPTFIAADIGNAQIAMELKNAGDYVVIRMDAPGDMETQRGHAAAAADERVNIRLELYTVGSAQRLYDLKQELRRILYTYKHSMTNYQRIRYGGFMRESSAEINFWNGSIRLTLESDGVPVPTDINFSDDFGRADNGLGASWSVKAGTWGILTEQAKLASVTASAIVVSLGGTPASACRLVCDVKMSGTPYNCGLVFRWQDVSNYWVYQLNETTGVQYLQLVKVEGGVSTAVVDYVLTGFVADQTYELELVLRDTRIACYFDGSELMRYESALCQSQVSHGLWSDNNQNARFDNFWVYR